MKKSYFITWIGAISTIVVTFLGTSHKVKKYGQKIHEKPKPNLIKTLELANKGLDYLPMVLDKIKK